VEAGGRSSLAEGAATPPRIQESLDSGFTIQPGVKIPHGKRDLVRTW